MMLSGILKDTREGGLHRKVPYIDPPVSIAMPYWTFMAPSAYDGERRRYSSFEEFNLTPDEHLQTVYEHLLNIAIQDNRGGKGFRAAEPHNDDSHQSSSSAVCEYTRVSDIVVDGPENVMLPYYPQGLDWSDFLHMRPRRKDVDSDDEDDEVVSIVDKHDLLAKTQKLRITQQNGAFLMRPFQNWHVVLTWKVIIVFRPR